MVQRSRSPRRGAVLPALVCLLVSFQPRLAHADWPEIPFGTTANEEYVDQFALATAPLPGGGFAGLWLVGFGSSTLHMQWLDAEGQTVLGNGGQQIAGGGGSINAATVIANPQGGAFVGLGERQATGFTALFVQSFDPAGNPRWPGDGVGVSSLLDDSQDYPFLVPDGSGGVFACFSTLQNPGVWCQRLDANGNTLWPPTGVFAGGTTGFLSNGLGVADNQGGLLVFWRFQGDPDAPPGTMRMEGQRLAADGQPLWGDGMVVADTNLEEFGGFLTPRSFGVVGDGAGGAILVFEGKASPDSENFDVMAQRVTPTGTVLWGEDGTVVVADAEDTIHETTVAGPDGGVFVITRESIGPEGTHLRAFRLDNAGQRLWAPEGVDISDPADRNLAYFAQASFDDSVLRIAWTEQLAEISPELDIRLSRIRPDGEPILPLETVTSVVSSQFSMGLSYSPATRKIFVLWEDTRGGFGSFDTYAAENLASTVFADGFELGDTSAWSSVQP